MTSKRRPPAEPGPIDPAYRAQMQGLAQALDETFNGKLKGHDRKVWFFLAAGNFGGPPGLFNYISNANKVDVRDMLQDILDRLEQRLANEAPEPRDG
jgi:hypothetical protein